jgi:hypothetical protein
MDVFPASLLGVNTWLGGSFLGLKEDVSSMSPTTGDRCSQSDGPPPPNAEAPVGIIKGLAFGGTGGGGAGKLAEDGDCDIVAPGGGGPAG